MAKLKLTYWRLMAAKLKMCACTNELVGRGQTSEIFYVMTQERARTIHGEFDVCSREEQSAVNGERWVDGRQSMLRSKRNFIGYMFSIKQEEETIPRTLPQSQ